ncbi:MAG: thioredoxin family protein [Candidatus Omnitrophota bacterium]
MKQVKQVIRFTGLVVVVIVIGLIFPLLFSAENQSPNPDKNIKVTFIELGSVRCKPCKAMQPIIAEIEKEYKGQVKVIFYDVWLEENKQYAEKYKIDVIPTQVFLDKNGKEYFRHIGFFPKEEIIKIFKQKGVK